MGSTNFSPRFVRGRVKLDYEGASHDLGESLLNSAGLPPMPWTAFDPAEHLGRRGRAVVEVFAAKPWAFECDVLLTCERVAGKSGCALGLTFLFKSGDGARLDATVASEGVLPEYVRKLPRIHYVAAIPVFPSRAVVRFFYGQEDIIVSCDVENVSPSGLLVHTDDARTEALLPDETVRVALQPRGSWLRPIQANAQVKRMTHMVDPLTGNMRRYFGLSISTLSAEAKANFTDLLRQIVLLSRR